MSCPPLALFSPLFCELCTATARGPTSPHHHIIVHSLDPPDRRPIDFHLGVDQRTPSLAEWRAGIEQHWTKSNPPGRIVGQPLDRMTDGQQMPGPHHRTT